MPKISADEQLERWVKGEALCPNESGECCPDFGCCVEELLWPPEKRRKFAEADRGTRAKMVMGALGAAMSHAFRERGEPGRVVRITRGVPEDDA
jgi:hypothetical protein